MHVHPAKPFLLLATLFTYCMLPRIYLHMLPSERGPVGDFGWVMGLKFLILTFHLHMLGLSILDRLPLETTTADFFGPHSRDKFLCLPHLDPCRVYIEPIH